MTVIDTQREEIEFKFNNQGGIIPYVDARINQNEYSSLQINSYNYMENNDRLYDDYDCSYDISTEEIDAKINSCDNLKDYQKLKLQQLILKNKYYFKDAPVY